MADSDARRTVLLAGGGNEVIGSARASCAVMVNQI